MNKKIIHVIEDHDSLRQFIVYGLKNTNKYNVKEFSTGTKFLEYLNNNNKIPDLIILDLILPLISGEEIIRFLKEKYKRKIYIIVISAKTLSKNVVDVLNYGADDYVKKPLSIKELIARIENYLNK